MAATPEIQEAVFLSNPAMFDNVWSRYLARAAAVAPVIVVTIGTLFSTAIERILPSSVFGPLRVGVLIKSCTEPFLM